MTTKRTKKERQAAIDIIIIDAMASYDYKDFIAECVEKFVSTWDDDELDSWFGIEESDEQD